MATGPLDRRAFVAGLAAAALLGPDRAAAQANQFSAAVAAARTIGQGAVALAELFERFVTIGYRLEDLVNRRRAEEDLAELYHGLGRLVQVQEILIGHWPAVLRSPPSAEGWRGWRRYVDLTRATVQQTGRAIESYRGAFSYRPEFRQLQRAIARRGVLLGYLLRMPRPTNAAGLRRLNEIRAEYERLIFQLERLADAMGRFLGSIGRG